MQILIIRSGRIGDMVMLTPALQALGDAFPKAEFTLLTSADGKRVFSSFIPEIKKFILYDRKKIFSFLEKAKIRRKIRAQNFKHIFCFEINKSYYKFFDGTKAKVHKLLTGSDEVHYSKHCFDLVQTTIDFKLKPKWAWLPVEAMGKILANSMLENAGIKQNDFVIGLHPSTSGVSKLPGRKQLDKKRRLWPQENFAELARLLNNYAKTDKRNIHIIIDLLPDEKELGESINKLAGGIIKVFMEPPNFSRYKALIKRMNLLVTSNTGPMHLAAALGTKMVVLFADLKPSDCGPYMPENKFAVLQAEQTKHPQKGLSAISPNMVFKASINFLTE